MSALRERRRELEREVAERKRVFVESREALVNAVKDELRPVNLVRHSVKPLLGGLFTLLSASKLLHRFTGNGPSRPSESRGRRTKMDWMWKALKLGWSFRSSRLVRFAVLPLMAPLFKKSLGGVFKNLLRGFSR